MKKYYVKINEVEQGPYSAKEMRNMHLGDNVLVRVEGEHTWKPAGLYNFERLMAQELMRESRQSEHRNVEDLSEAAVAVETRRWNWGACLLPALWGAFNGVWWPLIILPLHSIPIVRLVVMIVMGVNGGRKAWERKEWQGVKHYMSVQHNWAIAGVVVFVLRLFVIIGYIMLVGMGMLLFEI